MHESVHCAYHLATTPFAGKNSILAKLPFQFSSRLRSVCVFVFHCYLTRNLKYEEETMAYVQCLRRSSLRGMK